MAQWPNKNNYNFTPFIYFKCSFICKNTYKYIEINHTISYIVQAYTICVYLNIKCILCIFVLVYLKAFKSRGKMNCNTIIKDIRLHLSKNCSIAFISFLRNLFIITILVLQVYL